MNHTVVCPDCHSHHAEPLEATIGLFAICADCAVAIDVRTERERSYVLETAA